jgi:unsaturated chondroitin disaccharide hydrolase
LAAARQLLALARTNAGGGTIPTRLATPSRQESDTIIDSLMNLPLLYWATSVTGDGSFRAVAARHARRVESLLVRRDGSTAQSVHQNRRTGRVIRIHSHQGISAASTWARGQGWAIYGLTASAEALNDRRLLAAAERAARWAADHLPRSGVPRYDYDAPPGGNADTSAGVITATGLFRLSAACTRRPGACAQADRWKPLAQRMLNANLRHVSTALPLGFFGRQTATHGGVRWDDQAELVYGLYYALEGVQIGRSGT